MVGAGKTGSRHVNRIMPVGMDVKGDAAVYIFLISNHSSVNLVCGQKKSSQLGINQISILVLINIFLANIHRICFKIFTSFTDSDSSSLQPLKKR